MPSDAQKKATKKWNAANLEMIQLQKKIGTKAQWKTWADASGLSLAAYVTAAVEEKARRDGLVLGAPESL